MDLGLTDRVALVTGASSGIGRGIAEALVAEGARVAIASRSRERIDATAAQIGARGFVWDSADLDAVPPLIAQVQTALAGPVEVLVCNTGGPPAGADALGFDADDWRTAHRTLVEAPLALVGAVMPGMVARRWGRILNVASTSVREPIGHLVLSNAERSAALAAWKTIAGQVAADGVTLNTVLPGRILTDRLTRLSGSAEAAERSAQEHVPAGRTGRVDEIAAVAAFLCSARASYVTGVAVPVDGGLLRGI
jgi:3-oxoacyl-[acyl-carrier protein] reductase